MCDGAIAAVASGVAEVTNASLKEAGRGGPSKRDHLRDLPTLPRASHPLVTWADRALPVLPVARVSHQPPPSQSHPCSSVPTMRVQHTAFPLPNFPVYSSAFVSDDELVIGGGGGQSKSGIKNKIVNCLHSHKVSY